MAPSSLARRDITVKIVVPTRGSLLVTGIAARESAQRAHGRERGADDARLRSIGGAANLCGAMQEVPVLIEILADRAANDEQIRPKQGMQAPQILVDARTPGGPVEPFRRALARRGDG